MCLLVLLHRSRVLVLPQALLLRRREQRILPGESARLSPACGYSCMRGSIARTRVRDTHHDRICNGIRLRQSNGMIGRLVALSHTP